MLILFNHSNEDFQVNPGDRIGQLVITKIANFEVEEVQELSETVRGEDGFGSTGILGQRHMQSLPRSVLTYILGFLTAEEYFLNANLVSKSWHNLVTSWNYTIEYRMQEFQATGCLEDLEVVRSFLYQIEK